MSVGVSGSRFQKGLPRRAAADDGCGASGGRGTRGGVAVQLAAAAAAGHSTPTTVWQVTLLVHEPLAVSQLVVVVHVVQANAATGMPIASTSAAAAVEMVLFMIRMLGIPFGFECA
jgi:hypothetical protein